MAITAVRTQAGFIVTGTTTATSDDVTDDKVCVNSFYWLKPTTTHKLAIQNKKGDEIHEFYSITDDADMYVDMHQTWLDGIYINDMGSGTLYINIA